MVEAGTGKSVGSGKATLEALNFGFSLASIQDRLLDTPHRLLRPLSAVGRFVWMMSGSDRLADIAFYEPKVASFSDDGLRIEGSNYGARLLCPRAGLNQIERIISLLRADPATRRAAAPIYQPEDTGRDSRDIPCAFGLMYRVQNGELHATTIMRSNNAWTLLPYNVFEFTLLAEVIAAELGMRPGSYFHFATSMHLYEGDASKAWSAIREPARVQLDAMPPFPPGAALAELRELLRFEVEVRTTFAGLNAKTYGKALKSALAMKPLWRDLAMVVLVQALRRAGREPLASRVVAELAEPLATLTKWDLGWEEAPAAVADDAQLTFTVPEAGDGASPAEDPQESARRTDESIRFYQQRAREYIRQAQEKKP